jgi:pimeloyl-ACP methyl ester carboxylesterase
VASLEPVILGGQEQWILVRALHPDAPVLLYLAGGPGQSDLPFSRVLLSDIAQDFVVVSWDQRGTGKSYPALEPTAMLTPDRVVADVIELTELLRTRFSERRIYLLGESWGTTLAVLAAQRRPDLYHAVLSSGQMVSPRATDVRLYHDVLAHAAATDDEALATRMRAYGEPPYASVYAYGTVMGLYDALAGPYTPPAAYLQRGRDAGLGFMGVKGSEYDLIDKVNVMRGLLDVFSVLYPQLQQVDFRRDVPRLEVPLYVFDGGHELAARRDLALAWYQQVDAPIKHLYTFENAGHSVAFEHFQDLHRILVDTVLPETYPRR